ncbi:asparagine synthase (glutamine-hydrolyzing) [Rubrobacter marinus]|uniref:asparagine synthase (glutamine-hydrolyzing) n=1 Tax=Rubrobacter marinus TaxID=2653852 RepID=UPI001A9EA0C2|nr:asparagine synthase (glutamine-hydrolyzing) [Rubrobacter marinus]
MCGIVAQHGRLDPVEAQRMLSRLTHRGPDDEGTARVGDAWLGHRRLSIVDVSGGKQPLETSGGLSLVGNGEVYNHAEVRGTLAGNDFRTSSDNEVALHLVAERGPDALKDLLGMYAFVVAGRDGSFVAARDPVGIKPLYWARRDGRTVFASELGAYDEDWLGEVEAFPPGFYWTPEGGLTRFRAAVPEKDEALNRFDGPTEPGAPIPEEMLALVRERLIETVERQMMGDVPVGVFLSGGLDSSLVAAIAARWYEGRGEKLKTFAVGLEGSSDLLAARAVAEHLGTEHHESVYTAGEALDVLPEVVRCIESFDPSLVRSAVPNYMLAQFTAESVKVVLTGEGPTRSSRATSTSPGSRPKRSCTTSSSAP